MFWSSCRRSACPARPCVGLLYAAAASHSNRSSVGSPDNDVAVKVAALSHACTPSFQNGQSFGDRKGQPWVAR